MEKKMILILAFRIISLYFHVVLLLFISIVIYSFSLMYYKPETYNFEYINFDLSSFKCKRTFETLFSGFHMDEFCFVHFHMETSLIVAFAYTIYSLFIYQSERSCFSMKLKTSINRIKCF